MSTVFWALAKPCSVLEETDIAIIASRAMTPLEHREHGGTPVPPDDNAHPRRVSAWAQALGGQQALDARLHDIGITVPEELLCLQAPTERVLTLPWVSGFLQLYQRVDWDRPFAAASFPLPFAAIVQVWVEAASQALRACPATRALPVTAWDALRGALAGDIAAIVSCALQADYNVFSLRVMPGLDADSQTRLETFYRAQMSDGMAAFFYRYPMAMKHLATACARWVVNTRSFALRLREDQDALSERWSFFRPERLTALSLGLSDAHDGGKTVIGMVFPEGDIYYKPKPLAAEVFFARYTAFLETCDCADPGTFTRVDALNRGDYGWVRGVRVHSFAAETELHAYFEHAGALLGALYLVGGTDVHVENLIASQNGPVLIDAETLFHPPVAVDGMDSASVSVNRTLFTDSIIRTGLLPWWNLTAAGQPLDVGGLTGGTQPPDINQRIWLNLNTDRQKLVRRPGKGRTSLGNLPVVDGKSISAAAHVDPVVAGFTDLMQRASARKTQLQAWLDSNTPQDMPLRFIFRSTAIYLRTLQNLHEPAALGSAYESFLTLERLARPRYSHPGADYPPLALLDSERTQLMARDVPIFTMHAAKSSLETADSLALDGFFECSGIEFATSRLQGLGPRQITLQTQLLRTSFALASDEHMAAGRTATTTAPQTPDSHISATHSQSAEAIAQRLTTSAFCAEDGSVNWVSVIYQDRLQRWQVQPLGVRLFDGISGMAVFYAALFAQTQQSQHAAMLKRIVATLESTVAHPSFPRDAARLGLGIATGVASVADTLGRLAGMPAYRHLHARAQASFQLLAQLSLSAEPDSNHDLFGGLAGALAAMALSPQSVRDVDCLKAIRARLINYLHSPAWQHLPAGFAHGRAGILWALGKSHAAAGLAPGERALLRSALHTLADEFLAEHANWLDPRYPQALDGAGVTWTFCGGAPGIVHGANVALAAAGDAALIDRWDAIQQAVGNRHRKQPDNPVDHLCCGNFGRALALETTEGGSVKSALKHARPGDQLPRDTYRLGWSSMPDVPGLFQGLAGIGLAHLSLNDPAQAAQWLWWRAGVPS